jgi:hypothetical protein
MRHLSVAYGQRDPTSARTSSRSGLIWTPSAVDDDGFAVPRIEQGFERRHATDSITAAALDPVTFDGARAGMSVGSQSSSGGWSVQGAERSQPVATRGK